MKNFEEIIQSIAHISHTLEIGLTVYFQELNENQDDWDEEATNLLYQDWLSKLK